MYNYDQIKNQMTPEMMKSMSSMFSTMSDDQIRNYSKIAGLGNIDPQFLRNQANMMQNVKNEDISERLKNVTPEQISEAQRRQQQFQSTQQQPQQQQQTQQQQSKSSNVDMYPTLTKLKNQGNDAFTKQDYEKAASKYYEAISEIEEMWENNQYLKSDERKQKELKNIENVCRLNYCNVKAKQNQYDVVKRQAKIVLQNEPMNGKANFRMGQALFQTGQYQDSLQYLKIASQELQQDNLVQQLYQDAQNKINQKQDQQDQQEKVEIVQEQNENQQKNNQDQQQKITCSKQEESQEDNSQKNKPKIKLSSIDTNSNEFLNLKQKVQQQSKEDGMIIDEQQQNQKEDFQTNSQQNNLQQQSSNQQQQQQSQDDILKQHNQLKNMNQDQINTMTTMFKTMDKSMIKNLMKQQGGMDMSDAQIEMMQNMITPDMLEQVKKMDPQQIKDQKEKYNQQQNYYQQQQQQNNEGQPQQSQVQQPTQQQQPLNQQMPKSLADLAQNPQMLTQLMDLLKSNPAMIKSMVPMFGQNNAISNYVENASPEQLGTMIGRLVIVLKFLLFLYRIWLYARNQWKFFLGFFLAYLIFKLF